MEDFEISSFIGRDEAKKILTKIKELRELLYDFRFDDTSEISLKELEEALRESIIKFEKSKL